MMKPQATHYRIGTKVSAPEIVKRLKNLLTKHNIVTVTAAFLLGRSALIGGFMPFGFPLFVAVYGSRASRIAVAAAIIAGMASRGDGRQIIVNLGAMALFALVSIFHRKICRAAAHKLALLAMMCVMIPETMANIYNGFMLFDLINTLFHGFIALTLVIIYKKAAIVLKNEGAVRSLSGEEVISVAIVASLCVVGLSELRVLGFSIGNILCIAIILYFSNGYGPGAGAAVGLTAGLLLSMSLPGNYMIICNYAFCGFMAGILSKMGRTGSSIGFLMANAILTVYLTGSTMVLIHIMDIAAGILVFMLMPAKAGNRVAGMLGNSLLGPDERVYGLRTKEAIVEKLQRFSRTFKELSETFEEVAHGAVTTGKSDIACMLEQVADKVCADCGLAQYCWDRNFYNTYQVMFKIIDSLDKKGRISKEDIPGYFMEKCERINEFVAQVCNSYEMLKKNSLWKNKIDEARTVISAQMDGMSQILSRLALEMKNNVIFRQDIGERLTNALRKEGIKAVEMSVFENRLGCLEISFRHAGCDGNMPCKTTIEKLAKKVTGVKLIREGDECGKKRFGKGCLLKLVQERKFAVTTGLARAPKYGNNVSGDNYTFMETCEGKYIAAISDGMGAGKAASNLSRITVSLIEQFMEAGFDKDMTLKIINSLLFVKSGDEGFSTIDLIVVDLYGGKAEFIKNGASTSFIKNNGGVKPIKTVSLPAGILSGMETEIQGCKIRSGDLVIMMSDGVLEPFGENADNSMRKYIEKTESINPQNIADSILDESFALCAGKPRDDMTVMVMKIWKRY